MTQTPSDTHRRAHWLKTLHTWHWISSALCLATMLLFAFTGITLNHAADIESKARVQRASATVPVELRQALLAVQPSKPGDKVPVPASLAQWVRTQWGGQGIDITGHMAEWSDDEIYVPRPRPGGDLWVRVSLSDGLAEFEDSDRGWIAYLNDLHKGRHTGAAWQGLIDIFAGACLVFTITGLLILQRHATQRPWTWPLTGLGLMVPVLLLLLWVHG